MGKMLIDFLKWTAWPMTKPAAYGTFHLTFLFVGLAVSVALALLLRRTNEKQNRAVLLVTGCFLILCELYKQLFYTFVIGGGAYQWWIFPFQMCSVPMYFCIAAAFTKGKVRQYMYEFMLAFNLMGGFISFLEPSGLCHEYWSLTIHAFTWHMTLVFLGLYLGFSGRAGRKLRDFRGTVVTFLALCAIAFGINLIFRGVSGGDINMFFVGPANSSLAVFKDIAAKYGWYVNLPIYLFAMCLGAFVFYMPFCLYHRRKDRRLVAV